MLKSSGPDATSEPRTDGLVPIQDIDTTRHGVIGDLVLTGDSHADSVHRFPRAPCSVLTHVFQVGSYESEGVFVVANLLPKSCGSVTTKIHGCAIDGGRAHVLAC